MQDPFERADFTSNTYWDWTLDHAPQMYLGMEYVSGFAASFKDFPPRSFPPSFNPANIIEGELRAIKAKQALELSFPMLRQDKKAQPTDAKKKKK